MSAEKVNPSTSVSPNSTPQNGPDLHPRTITNPSSPPPSPNSPTFMTLPPEIRMRIYHHLLPHFHPPYEIRTSLLLPLQDSDPSSSTSSSLSIYHVSKRITAELWSPYKSLLIDGSSSSSSSHQHSTFFPLLTSNSSSSFHRSLHHLYLLGFPGIEGMERLHVTSHHRLLHEATMLKFSSALKSLSLRLAYLRYVELSFTVTDERLRHLRDAVPGDWTGGLEVLIRRNPGLVDVRQVVVNAYNTRGVYMPLLDLIRQDVGNAFFRVRGSPPQEAGMRLGRGDE